MKHEMHFRYDEMNFRKLEGEGVERNARGSREPGKNIQICRKQGRGFLGRIMGGFAERTE